MLSSRHDSNQAINASFIPKTIEKQCRRAQVFSRNCGAPDAINQSTASLGFPRLKKRTSEKSVDETREPSSGETTHETRIVAYNNLPPYK